MQEEEFNLGAQVKRHNGWYCWVLSPVFCVFLTLLTPVVGMFGVIWISFKSCCYIRFCMETPDDAAVLMMREDISETDVEVLVSTEP